MTATKRAKASHDARIAAGYRVVRVYLPPGAVKALDSLTKQHGLTMTEAIALSLHTLDSLNLNV